MLGNRPPLLANSYRWLGRRLALLVGAIFAIVTISADFAGARLPTTDSFGDTVAAVSADGQSGNLAETASTGPMCQLSGSDQIAEAPCQPDKSTGSPRAALETRLAPRYTQSRAAPLSDFVIGPLDRPPNPLRL